MVRIVFMGTPHFAVPSLQALVDNHHVVGVVTQPDRPAGRGKKTRSSPIKLLAQHAGIPVYQPRSFKQESAADPLRVWQPEMIVVAAFGQILPAYLLELPALGCVNVHASLLPRWRGASPIQHAILAGDEETGITLMQMDVGLDTGGIYIQEKVSINDRETAATLHDRLAALGGEMLRQHLEHIAIGAALPIPQDDALTTYAPRIHKRDGLIDWEMPAETLERQIRALTPWPQAYTFWNGRLLKILAGRIMSPGAPDLPVGTVFASDGGAVVQTGEAALQLDMVQLAGKKKLPIADFLRGQPDFINAQLGI